jgi:hypothetical protein
MSRPAPRLVDVARSVVVTVAALLHDRLVAALLIGSGADATDVRLSDIDLIVVLNQPFGDDAERDTVCASAERVSAVSGRRLDLSFVLAADLPSLHMVIQVAIKQESLLLWGEDVRRQIALPPLDQYARDVSDGTWHFVAGILRGTDQLVVPLTAPDPQDALLGYARVRIAPWYPVGTQRGTKELVATATRIATALLAISYDRYAGSKRSAVGQYAQAAHGTTWASFPQEVFRRCKLEWSYEIPEAQAEQRALRSLCVDMLQFEQSYCATYRAYLYRLAEDHNAVTRAWAHERLPRLSQQA